MALNWIKTQNDIYHVATLKSGNISVGGVTAATEKPMCYYWSLFVDDAPNNGVCQDFQEACDKLMLAYLTWLSHAELDIIPTNMPTGGNNVD